MIRIIVLITFLNFHTADAQTRAIEAVKSGKGQPVLYLPGFATPGKVWDETISHVKVMHESHAITYAGFGGLKPIDTPWYSVIRQSLIDYIKEQKFTKLTIVGHSMGGNLAVDLAASLPDVVDKIILVDAIPCMRVLMMPGVPASAIQYKSPYNETMIKMPEEKFKQSVAMMAGNMTLDKAKADSIIAWTLKSDRKTYVYGYTDLLRLDLREELKNVKAKTLILGAANMNEDLIRKNYIDQYQNLREKTLEIAKDSRHFIMFDQPEWLYSKINGFLEL